MWPGFVLRSRSVGMRLSGSPRILSRPNGSLGPSARVLIWEEMAAAARRLPTIEVAL